MFSCYTSKLFGNTLFQSLLRACKSIEIVAMLETQSLTTATTLKPSELPKVLIQLSNKGWQPAILETQRTFLQLAGVADKIVNPTEITEPFERGLHSGVTGGDVFFKDKADLYYVLIAMPQVFHEEDTHLQLEVGLVSLNNVDLNQRISIFIEAVEKAIQETLKEQENNSIEFDWKEQKPDTPSLDRLIVAGEEQSDLRLTRAKCISEELHAAVIISNKLVRDTLIDLSKAVFARERDILGRRNKVQDNVRDAIDKLKQAELLNVEYLLECKRTGTPLTRLKNQQQLDNTDVANLACPSCGLLFSQETLSEGYSLTALGRKMSRQSHWMTVWVTSILVKLGVPEDSILWNIAEAGEEIDLLVEYLGQLWLFELKDREFGAGDAYPLNYRQVRYGANKTIIFTTAKVSKDAKRVLEDLARERSERSRYLYGEGRLSRQSHIIYVEGLEAAEDILRKEVSNASIRYARQKLSWLSNISGYDFGKILSARLGQTLEEQPEEYDIYF